MRQRIPVLLLLASSAVAARIPISGGGSASYDFDGVDLDGGYELFVTGRGVELNIVTGHELTAVDLISHGTFIESRDEIGYGRIDGIESDLFHFRLGGGGGFLRLYGVRGEILAEAELISWVAAINVVRETGPGPGQHRGHADINVTADESPLPVPEPSTEGLVALSLIGLVGKFAGRGLSSGNGTGLRRPQLVSF